MHWTCTTWGFQHSISCSQCFFKNMVSAYSRNVPSFLLAWTIRKIWGRAFPEFHVKPTAAEHNRLTWKSRTFLNMGSFLKAEKRLSYGFPETLRLFHVNHFGTMLLFHVIFQKKNEFWSMLFCRGVSIYLSIYLPVYIYIYTFVCVWNLLVFKRERTF